MTLPYPSSAAPMSVRHAIVRVLLANLIAFAVTVVAIVALADTTAPPVANPDSLSVIAADVKQALHVPRSTGDLLFDLAVLGLCLGLLNNAASALANSKVISDSRFGPMVHTLAGNISAAANAEKAAAAAVNDLIATANKITTPEGMFHVVAVTGSGETPELPKAS